ncbi:hypothetical protein BD410DRAFT_846762 [Rickenella mellea]|uniref:Uncharacterized protein n=1 Tax=Rickenella mellea TaxID=50990 RepID=A0A4Y7PEA2_9AGAM|nr:hypothetical protein BD410DRAFT_846762 [Rickenella mellea]
MRFQSALLTLVAVASAALASPSLKRDGITVSADFTNIATDVKNFNGACLAFKNPGGTLAQANNILAAGQTLDTDIKKATTDATASPAFTVNDSATLVAQAKTIQGLVVTAVGSLIADKSAFESLPLKNATGIVASKLTVLKSDTSALGAAVLLKTSPDQQKNGQIVFTAILNQLDLGISAFTSS